MSCYVMLCPDFVAESSTLCASKLSDEVRFEHRGRLHRYNLSSFNIYSPGPQMPMLHQEISGLFWVEIWLNIKHAYFCTYVYIYMYFF